MYLAAVSVLDADPGAAGADHQVVNQLDSDHFAGPLGLRTATSLERDASPTAIQFSGSQTEPLPKRHSVQGRGMRSQSIASGAGLARPPGAALGEGQHRPCAEIAYAAAHFAQWAG